MKLETYFTQSKHNILKQLDYENPKTQTELSKAVKTSQTAVSNHIRRFEEENIVENEGLRNGYILTEKGGNLLDMMEEAQDL
jgi:predicted transcriptional regulator